MLMFFTGRDILELRKRLGLTQKELGKRVGASEGAVSLWESDDRQPRRKFIERLNEIADKANGKVRVTA